MPKATTRVFVVDDDSSARSGLGRLLKSLGFKVKLFSSAQEFLDSGPVESDAVAIFDLRMPGISGLELQKRLRAAGETLPVIFLTAFEDLRARREALEQGAIAFLQKPVEEKVLLEAIRKAERTKPALTL
jgi:two-component system, LuxR family, response regulator FixJ